MVCENAPRYATILCIIVGLGLSGGSEQYNKKFHIIASPSLIFVLICTTGNAQKCTTSNLSSKHFKRYRMQQY